MAKNTKSEQALADALIHLSFVLQGQLTSLAAESQLSVSQVRLLGILRDHEPTMLALATYLTLEKSSLSGLIDRAEARGLVERVVSAHDKRSIHVRITPRGLALAERLEQRMTRDAQGLWSALSVGERQTLWALVDKMLANAQAPGAQKQ